MMARAIILVYVFIAMIAVQGQAVAQPADLPIPAATTDRFPPGVSTGRVGEVTVYVDRNGQTLYGLDMRTVLRWAPDPSLYCDATCGRDWKPLLAPKTASVNIGFPGAGNRNRSGDSPESYSEEFLDNRTAPDWTVIAGPSGPQWVYKGWHMVFTRKSSKRGTADFDGLDGKIWNSLKYIPPLPMVVAPPQIAPKLVEGRYVLANGDGALLFTGICNSDCVEWRPLTAPAVSRGIGKWAVLLDGEYPQWSYDGAPVFVANGNAFPSGAKPLLPAPYSQ